MRCHHRIFTVKNSSRLEMTFSKTKTIKTWYSYNPCWYIHLRIITNPNSKTSFTLRVVKEEGGQRSRFTENKLVLSQFTGNKIGILRFPKKMTLFDRKLNSLWYLKSYTQSTALLDVFIIRPLFLRARIRRGLVVLSFSRNIRFTTN